MGKVKVIGNRVSAIYRSYVDENKNSRDVWHPMVEGDGRMLAVSDKSTASGIAEKQSRAEALKTAREFRDKMQA